MADNVSPDSTEYVTCPDCGGAVLIGKMNVCYIARRDCPNCGASVLVEGDKITVENNEPGKH